MSLINTVTSLLDLFRLNKGRKIAEEQVQPVAQVPPLIERLNLPPMPEFRYPIGSAKADFVEGVIRGKFPNGKISERVLLAICRRYNVDLRGRGFYKHIPGTRMIALQPYKA